MQKQIIKNEKLREQYYSVKHDSGLTILLYPMEGYTSSYALFGTKLGSIDTTFKTDKDSDFTVVPEGIAHFLEHKLFENEQGDAFSLFAKTGASANAYTSFERTCYLFSTTDNFEESLKTLLNFVQEPYFTDETVQKEQGIIGQEIKMYEDNPDWRVFFNLLSALYVNNPIKIDIAGTVESIAKIDAETLYKAYNTFYNLNNMVLSIAGNFDVDSALKVIEECIVPREKVNFTTKVFDEPANVNEAKIEQSLPVSISMFNIGFKEEPREGMDLLKTQLEFDVLLEIIFGETSKFYKDLYDEGLINQTFACEVFGGRGFFANIFSGESEKCEEVYECIKKEITRIKAEKISESDFIRTKKALYGKLVKSFNVVEGVANSLIAAHFKGVDIYDSVEIVENMSIDDINNLLLSSFDLDNSAISIINPA